MNNLKIAFITGATKGIGRSTAITFANAGWDLILLSRNMDLMEKLKSELLTTKSKINLLVIWSSKFLILSLGNVEVIKFLTENCTQLN